MTVQQQTVNGQTGTGHPYPQRFSQEDYTREETYSETRRPVDYATTLIPDAYRASAFYEVEQERVFASGWVAVGYVDVLREPGDTIVTDVAGQSVIVTRDKAGELHAFYNVCRHRGARLVTENCNLRLIRCPYHSWAYSLDGELRGAPLFEGSEIPEEQQAMFDTSDVREFCKEDYGLLRVRVDSWGFVVFVTLDSDAMPLAEWLGDLPERLSGYRFSEWVIVREKTYEVDANWKLIAENFMEYYHLPWVHPDLMEVSRMEDHYRFQGPGMYTGMCTTPISQDNTSGWLSLPPVDSLDPTAAVSGRFIWLFPNIALAILPNHAFTIKVTPAGYGHTVEETTLLVHPNSLDSSDSEDTLDQVLEFWDHVNLEDIEIVERVQAGIETRAYAGGRMCFKFEEPLHRFQNMVIDRMVGIRNVPDGDAKDKYPLFESSETVTGDQKNV